MVACPSWAYEQDYQFRRRLKRFGYIRCDTTVSVLIDFSGCVLFRILCLLKQFVHHLLPPLQKCNNLRDHGHPYELPDLWPPNSLDLNPIDYKIWVIIQQPVQSTKVQVMKDLIITVQFCSITSSCHDCCRWFWPKSRRPNPVSRGGSFSRASPTYLSTNQQP